MPTTPRRRPAPRLSNFNMKNIGVSQRTTPRQDKFNLMNNRGPTAPNVASTYAPPGGLPGPMTQTAPRRPAAPAAPAPELAPTEPPLGTWFPGGNPNNNTGGVTIDEEHSSGGRAVFRADNGNLMVRMPWGETVSFDPWGNRIPHLGFMPGDGGPPAAPPAPPTGGPTPPIAPPGGPPTFYSPTGPGQPLTFDERFLGLLGTGQRDALRGQVGRLGFTPTGSIGQFGEQSYVPPNNFNMSDLQTILDPALRQWLRFWLGDLGFKQAYTVPSSYTGGSIPPVPGLPLR